MVLVKGSKEACAGHELLHNFFVEEGFESLLEALRPQELVGT